MQMTLGTGRLLGHRSVKGQATAACVGSATGAPGVRALDANAVGFLCRKCRVGRALHRRTPGSTIR